VEEGDWVDGAEWGGCVVEPGGGVTSGMEALGCGVGGCGAGRQGQHCHII